MRCSDCKWCKVRKGIVRCYMDNWNGIETTLEKLSGEDRWLDAKASDCNDFNPAVEQLSFA